MAAALGLPVAPVLPGHALTGPSTVQRSSRSGRHRICPGAFKVALLVENGPGDAGELVGERDRQHVAVQPLFGRLDPGLEPVSLPALGLDQHNPGRLYEQNAQVAIATPRYLAEDRAVAGRDLLGHEPQPSREVAACGERVTGPDRRHHRAGDDRADAGHAHQPLTTAIAARDGFDLA